MLRRAVPCCAGAEGLLGTFSAFETSELAELRECSEDGSGPGGKCLARYGLEVANAGRLAVLTPDAAHTTGHRHAFAWSCLAGK